MQIKSSLKSLLAGAFATAGLAAAADPTVTVDEVANGDPWSTITVKYTLDGVETQYKHKVAFDVTAKDVTKGVTNAAADLTSGSFEQVIDTAALFGEAKTDPEANVRVSLIAVKPLPKPDNTYMIINLATDGNGKYLVTYEDIADQATANAKFNTDTYKTDYLVLRKVKAGKSYYYAPQSNATLDDSQKIPVNRDYWIGLFETTEAQYAKVMGGSVTDGLNPARINYQDIRGTGTETAEPTATSFLGKLSTNCVDADGNIVAGFDLPTEAQWEIACRANTATRFCCADSEVHDYGVILQPSFAHVGTKLPNQWGLYDMHGNVWEWCRDARLSDSAVSAAEEFRTQATGGNAAQRIIRSGAYWEMLGSTEYCRSSYRDKEDFAADPGSYGFRLCRMAPAQ